MAPDGGWGWFIVCSAHMNELFFDGLAASVAVLLVRLKEYFGEGAGKISLIASIGLFVFHCSAPISSALSNKYGYRLIAVIGSILSAFSLFICAFANDVIVLCITSGFLANFGLSLSYVQSFALLGHYFNKKHALANGLASAGYGLGVMGLPMLCQWLIITYGWRGTYIIFSGLAANLLAAAALLRPLPTDKKEDLKISDVINDKCHSCICRIFGCHIICASPLLLGILVGLFFLSASSHTFVTFLLLRVSDLGVEPMHASYLITILGASSFATRLLHGWFVDRRVISPAVIFIASIVLWGLLNLAFPVIIGYWWIACFCVLFGFSNGIYNSLHYVVVKDSVYKEHFTGAIGLDLTAFGLGCFVGIPIAGKLYDIFGSADVAFYCTGISALISAIVFSLTHILQRRHNNHTMRRTYQTDEKQHSENISMTCEDDKTLFQLISVM